MKRRRILKLLSVLMAAVMIISVFAACGSRSESPKTSTQAAASTQASTADTTPKLNPDEPGYKLDTSPITFDWYINAAWWTQKFGEDYVSKLIKEKTGVTLNYIAPTGNEADKLNVMIASNDMPDFLSITWYDPGYKKLLAGKFFQPLNKLADASDPYFYKVASKGVLGWYTEDDGNVYAYPDFYWSPESYETRKNDPTFVSNSGVIVRKDMYEAIGSPDITTPEGFLNVLKAAKEKYPTVSGKPLIPFGIQEYTDTGSTSLMSFMQDYCAIPLEKDGKIYDRISDSEYLTWMRTLRKANEMGLISKDIFIDKRAQTSEKISQGRYFCMLYNTADFQPEQTALYQKDPNSVYMGIAGFLNSRKDQPTLGGLGPAGWMVTGITNKTKNAERAIRFLTYLVSEEGQKDCALGKKGETWDTIDGRDQLKPEIKAESAANNDAYRKKYALGEHWLMWNDYQDKWAAPPSPERALANGYTAGKLVFRNYFDDIDPAADSPEGIAKAKIDKEWGQVQAKLILAKTDAEFDTIFNNFLKYRQDNGWDKILAYQQAIVDKHKQKLGMK